MNKSSGLSCPVCGFYIHYSIEELLSSSVVIVCPGCGLELRMNRHNDQNLEAKSRLATAKEADKK